MPLPLPLQNQRVTWGRPRSGWDSRDEKCNSGHPFHQEFPVSHLPGREGCGEGGLFHGLRPSKIGLGFVRGIFEERQGELAEKQQNCLFRSSLGADERTSSELPGVALPSSAEKGHNANGTTLTILFSAFVSLIFQRNWGAG